MLVVILGPPAVGKSTVAEQLCDYFKLHHIHVKHVIDEGVDRMVSLSCFLTTVSCCGQSLMGSYAYLSFVLCQNLLVSHAVKF